LKIVHFTNNLTDGAGRAAYRIHRALINEGLNSIMLVANKDSQDNSVVQISNAYKNIDKPIKQKKDLVKRSFDFLLFIIKQFHWKMMLIRWVPKTLYNFNVSYVSYNKIKQYLEDVDIISLYSIQSFLSSKIIKKIYNYTKAPIVWTPMDIEPMSGGCHFNNGCERFNDSCGDCPQLVKSKRKDISRLILNKKRKDYNNLPITIVACSSWVEAWVRKSSIFKNNRIEKIFLGVDNTIFHSIDKENARKTLGLPLNKKLILFMCFNLDDKRKGGDYLLKALDNIYENINKKKTNIESNEINLVTIGRLNDSSFNNMPFDNIHLGLINDDRILAMVYNAVDVVAVPSIDDPGPMIINEAYMCETPIVAFDIGVASDILGSSQGGYIIKDYDINKFSSALYECLDKSNSVDQGQSSNNLRKQLTIKYQSKKYISLFKEILIK
jgi:glycosyltransferase involved in cell wall biosynthesis